MIISIDDRLEKLYSDLKFRNYDVHRFSEGVPGDVVIYSGDTTHLRSLNSGYSQDSGVFLIDGDNIMAGDIERIIKCRTYSSLF